MAKQYFDLHTSTASKLQRLRSDLENAGLDDDDGEFSIVPPIGWLSDEYSSDTKLRTYFLQAGGSPIVRFDLNVAYSILDASLQFHKHLFNYANNPTNSSYKRTITDFVAKLLPYASGSEVQSVIAKHLDVFHREGEPAYTSDLESTTTERLVDRYDDQFKWERAVIRGNGRIYLDNDQYVAYVTFRGKRIDYGQWFGKNGVLANDVTTVKEQSFLEELTRPRKEILTDSASSAILGYTPIKDYKQWIRAVVAKGAEEFYTNTRTGEKKPWFNDLAKQNGIGAYAKDQETCWGFWYGQDDQYGIVLTKPAKATDPMTGAFTGLPPGVDSSGALKREMTVAADVSPGDSDHGRIYCMVCGPDKKCVHEILPSVGSIGESVLDEVLYTNPRALWMPAFTKYSSLRPQLVGANQIKVDGALSDSTSAVNGVVKQYGYTKSGEDAYKRTDPNNRTTFVEARYNAAQLVLTFSPTTSAKVPNGSASGTYEPGKSANEVKMKSTTAHESGVGYYAGNFFESYVKWAEALPKDVVVDSTHVTGAGTPIFLAESKDGKIAWFNPQVDAKLSESIGFGTVDADGNLTEGYKDDGVKGSKVPIQYIQYHVDEASGALTPAGQYKSPKFEDKIPAGLYTVSEDMSGNIYITPTSISTDELLKFEDSRYNKVLEEIDKFWGLAESYKQMGFTHKRGVMLTGRPGTGKSCLLKQVMESSIEKDIPVFVGTSPGLLSRCLHQVRQVESDRKLLGILEDVDNYSYNEQPLLQLFDGDRTVGNILYLATTNYPEKLPERIMRTGRFDTKCEVLNPPATGRLAYFKHKNPELSESQLKTIVDSTDDFSFADMREFAIRHFIYGDSVVEAAARVKKQSATAKGQKGYAPSVYAESDESDSLMGLLSESATALVVKVLPTQAQASVRQRRLRVGANGESTVEATPSKELLKKAGVYVVDTDGNAVAGPYRDLSSVPGNYRDSDEHNTVTITPQMVSAYLNKKKESINEAIARGEKCTCGVSPKSEWTKSVHQSYCDLSAYNGTALSEGRLITIKTPGTYFGKHGVIVDEGYNSAYTGRNGPVIVNVGGKNVTFPRSKFICEAYAKLNEDACQVRDANSFKSLAAALGYTVAITPDILLAYSDSDMTSLTGYFSIADGTGGLTSDSFPISGDDAAGDLLNHIHGVGDVDPMVEPEVQPSDTNLNKVATANAAEADTDDDRVDPDADPSPDGDSGSDMDDVGDDKDKDEGAYFENDRNYAQWLIDLKHKYPAEYSKFIFRGSVSGGANHISAEIKGQDRSYGFFDVDKDVGTVLGESIHFSYRPEKVLKERARRITAALKG